MLLKLLNPKTNWHFPVTDNGRTDPAHALKRVYNSKTLSFLKIVTVPMKPAIEELER